MIKHLVKLAEHLDKKGLYKEADYVDWMIKTASSKASLLARSIDLSDLNDEIKKRCKSSNFVHFNESYVNVESINIRLMPNKRAGDVTGVTAFLSYSLKEGVEEEHKGNIQKEIQESYGANYHSQVIKKYLHKACQRFAQELGARLSSAAHSSGRSVSCGFLKPIPDVDSDIAKK